MPILVDMAFKLMREEVFGFLEALSDENLASFLISKSPTYAVFTTAALTTAIFGLCTRKWGTPNSPKTQFLHYVVFLKSHNPRKTGGASVTKIPFLLFQSISHDSIALFFQ